MLLIFVNGIYFVFIRRNVDLSELTKKYQQLTSLIAEDKESLNTFQKQCEGDIRSLRNLTLDVMNSVKGIDEFDQ
jgi:hypothetical protein